MCTWSKKSTNEKRTLEHLKEKRKEIGYNEATMLPIVVVVVVVVVFPFHSFRFTAQHVLEVYNNFMFIYLFVCLQVTSKKIGRLRNMAGERDK